MNPHYSTAVKQELKSEAPGSFDRPTTSGGFTRLESL
jgi:hypothetical protein